MAMPTSQMQDAHQDAPTLLTQQRRRAATAGDRPFRKQVSFREEEVEELIEKSDTQEKVQSNLEDEASSPVVRLVVKGTFLDFSEGVGKTRAEMFKIKGRAKTDSILITKEEEEEYCPGMYADNALASDGSNSSRSGEDSSRGLVAEAITEVTQPAAKVEDVQVLPDAAPRPLQQQQKQQKTTAQTTVMMRNLPNNYTRDMLLDMLEIEGFSAVVTFLYLPMDFDRHANLGYAFVNLVDEVAADHFWQAFDGFSRWSLPTAKVCQIRWSGPHQGHQAHVDRYKNSPVMHASVPDEFKPMVFENGVRLAFPPPSRKLRPPVMRQK